MFFRTGNQLINVFQQNLFKNPDSEIENALTLIYQVSDFFAYKFDPLSLIKAVNYLYEIGYHKSLSALHLYCDMIPQIEERQIQIIPVTDVQLPLESHKIFAVARLLFVRKDREIILPEIRLGNPDIMVQPAVMLQATSLFPWFPLHIHQGVPFCLINGYSLYGYPQPPETYLDWCSQECELIEKPLRPNERPLDSVDEFVKLEAWLSLLGRKSLHPPALEFENAMLRLQTLRLISNVYPMSEQDEYDFLWGLQNFSEWAQYKHAVNRLQVRWNPVTNEFDRGI
ncbi:MAG: hypothetical protein MUE44_13935 [Oscillatoriaceae cyanobacterium Prado104]|jgi:hypothetical protein|nr:hypothetical protein [Oscillatoriaceae cyanobacterium Prado104]